MRRALLGALLFLQTTSAPGINFFSPRQDIEIGTASAEEAEKQLAVVRDAQLNLYVRNIGQRLLAASPLRQFRYQFRIVNSGEVNSLGFPNRTIYVFRGLLAMASGDDEVAAILAHEIGHVASRHATTQLSRQLLFSGDPRQAPVSILAGLPEHGWKNQLSRLGIVFGANAPFLHYTPAQETEAAAVADKLLHSGKFNRESIHTLFLKARETSPFLYNHPVDEIADVELLTVPKTSLEFRAFQRALAKLPQPPDRQPEPLGESLPNTYTHPQNYYKVNYPDGWQTSQISQDGAIIAPPNGFRRGAAGDDITSGLMMDMFEIPPDRPLTLDQATNRLLVSLRQKNQTMRVVPGAQTPILIHDQPGLRTVMLRGGLARAGNATVTEPSEVLWVVTRMYYQNLFYMVFVAPEEDFPAQQPIFEQIIRSVQIP